MTFRPPRNLADKIREKAKEMGIPINSLLIVICNEFLKEKENINIEEE